MWHMWLWYVIYLFNLLELTFPVCDTGFTDSGGACCAAGFTGCNGVCVVTGSVCCPAGQVNCNGQCVPSGQLCCPTGQFACGSVCVADGTVCQSGIPVTPVKRGLNSATCVFNFLVSGNISDSIAAPSDSKPAGSLVLHEARTSDQPLSASTPLATLNHVRAFRPSLPRFRC
jgi:hypothetical protein